MSDLPIFIYSFKISNQILLYVCVCGKCKLIIKFIWKMKKTRIVRNSQDETYSTRCQDLQLKVCTIGTGVNKYPCATE